MSLRFYGGFHASLYENEHEFEGQLQNGRTNAEGELCIEGVNKGLVGVIKVIGGF